MHKKSENMFIVVLFLPADAKPKANRKDSDANCTFILLFIDTIVLCVLCLIFCEETKV